MMTKEEIANNLNNDNHLVEVIECDRNGRTVYKVNVYSRNVVSQWFGLSEKVVVDKKTYPFYFETKEVIEEFMKYYQKFYYRYGTYWDYGDIRCLLLDTEYSKNDYYMVDSFKKKEYSGCTTQDKYHLQDYGVWNGEICIDGKYHTFERTCRYFTKILELENKTLPKEGQRTYYILTPKNEITINS